jgi:hypothetical protein
MNGIIISILAQLKLYVMQEVRNSGITVLPAKAEAPKYPKNYAKQRKPYNIGGG